MSIISVSGFDSTSAIREHELPDPGMFIAKMDRGLQSFLIMFVHIILNIKPACKYCNTACSFNAKLSIYKINTRHININE